MFCSFATSGHLEAGGLWLQNMDASHGRAALALYTTMPQCQSWGSNTKKHRVAHWTSLRSISNWHFFTVSWHDYVHALLVARHELCRTYSVPARPVHDRRHGEAMRFWKSCKIQVFSPDCMLVPRLICDFRQASMCHVHGYENIENVKLIDDTKEMRAIISWDILTNWSILLVEGQNLLLQQLIRWMATHRHVPCRNEFHKRGCKSIHTIPHISSIFENLIMYESCPASFHDFNYFKQVSSPWQRKNKKPLTTFYS